MVDRHVRRETPPAGVAFACLREQHISMFTFYELRIILSRVLIESRGVKPTKSIFPAGMLGRVSSLAIMDSFTAALQGDSPKSIEQR
jgi:hypothetical protein